MPELRIIGDTLDAIFDRVFADRTPEEREAIKRKFATEASIAGAPKRVEARLRSAPRLLYDAPMRFNVTVIDPPGERFAHFLFDIVRYVASTIELLGHDCTIERNRCEPSAINVLIGTHLLRSPADVAALLGSARDYVVLQTEIVADGAINGHTVRDRLDKVLLPLLRGARQVWDGLDTNVAFLATQGVKAAILRLGFCPRLEEIVHKPNRDIDFLFFGSLGPYRRAVLQKLDSLGYRVRAEFDAVSLFRNDLIARAEVVLTLRHNEALSHLPHARIVYLVNNRCLVVGEGGYGQEPVEDLFLWTNERQALVNLCRATRARKDRHELAQVHYERLKQRPMTEQLAPLLADLQGLA